MIASVARASVAAVFALALLTPARAAASPTLDDLAWIAGAWEQVDGPRRIEEHWLPPAGNLMVGMGRTTTPGRKAFFEFLRIESRADGIFYVAQPGGVPPTAFKLTKLEDGVATFENPKHDHPKLIRYRRNADGSLTAEVEGDAKGKHVVERYEYRAIAR